MAELLFRDLQAADREPIARILRETGVFREEEVAVGLELVDESLNPGPTTDYRWIVAERAGRVAGFACFGPVPLTDASFDLYWIAVDPEARGAGIAAMMDEAACLEARRLGGRWLLAETSSLPAYEPARRFYLRRGYSLLARIPDFYRVGDDRLTFGKRLDE